MNAMFSDTSHACFSFDKCRVYTKPCDQQRVLFTACQVPRTLFMWLHMIYLKHGNVTEMPWHVSCVYLPFLTRCPPPVCGVRWWCPLRLVPSNTASLDSHQGASDRHMSLSKFCIERMYAVLIFQDY